MKMQKLNGLIATYNCSASSDNEKDSAYRLVCKMIEKELGCKRWLSSNIFEFLVEGEVGFNGYKIETICKWSNENDVLNNVMNSIRKLGFNCRLDSYHGGRFKNIVKC